MRTKKKYKKPKPIKVTKIYIGDKHVGTTYLYDLKKLDKYLGIKKGKKK